MNDTIPDWAVRRFCEGAGLNYHDVMSAVGPEAVVLRVTVKHGASLIAKHETKPVDPDEEAVKRILKAWYEGRGFGSSDALYPGALAAAVSQYKQEKANG